MLNDFLGTLSSRVIDQGEQNIVTGGLVPRLASRFEPGIGPVLPAADPGSDVEVPAGVETRGGKKPGRRPQASSRDEADGFRPARAEQAPPAPVGSPRRTWKEKTRLAHREDDLPAPHIPEPVRGQDRAGYPSVPFAPADAGPSDPPGRVEETDGVLQHVILRVSPPAPPREEPQRSLESAAGPVPGGLLPAHAVPAVPKTDPPGEPEAQAGPVIQTTNILERVELTRIESQAPVSELRSRLVPSLAMPDYKPPKTMTESRVEPPTIHVTIGRVEVKAIVPGASPKRPAPKSSTMSLDDYLRRRKGGER